MAKQLADLMLHISADTAELKKGLEDANSRLSKLGSQSTNIGSQIIGSFTKMGVAVGGVAGAFELVKSSMEKVQGTSKMIEGIALGGKEAFTQFQLSVVNLDFSHFFTKLADAYKVGKDFAEKMHELAIEQSYTSLDLSEKQNQITLMKEDYYMTTDFEKRKKLGKKIVDLQTEINKEFSDEKNKELQIVTDNWEKENHASAVAALANYDIYKDLTDKQKEAVKGLADMYGQGDINKGVQEYFQIFKELDGLNEGQVIAAAQIEQFDKKRKDSLKTLFDNQKGITEQLNESNLQLAMTEKRFGNITKQTEEILKSLKEAHKFNAEGYVDRGLTGTGVTPTLDNDLTKGFADRIAQIDTTKLVKMHQLTDDEIASINKENAAWDEQRDLIGGLQNVFSSLFSHIDEGWAGILKGFKEMLTKMVEELAEKAVIFGILNLLSGGSGTLASTATDALSKFHWFAEGTSYAPGGLAMVGEKGPELINLPRGSQVFSNKQTSNMLMGGGKVVFEIGNGVLRGALQQDTRLNNSFA
jgi:hypothetical protein